MVNSDLFPAFSRRADTASFFIYFLCVCVCVCVCVYVYILGYKGTSLMAQQVKHLPAMQETHETQV